jgi:3-dehydroquinate synthase
MGNTMISVTARTKNKSYDIHIGENILSQINRMDKILSADRFALFVSARIIDLYGDMIKKAFSQYSNFDIFGMRDGEKNKNFGYAEKFLEKMLKKGYTRKSAVIGIGGGVVGDFAGFIASVYMRGIPVIHIPTTLLAMVDSCIGGKTAVNLSQGKNIVGAFHQPEMVISDISFIQTLPEKELRNGLSELLKHALIGEEKLLGILYKNDLKSIRESDTLQKVVYLSALFKSRIVEEDEDEKGLRTILNFGHTAGHAIESMSGYIDFPHGAAVTIGLKIEIEISRLIGWLNDEDVKVVNELISRYNLINKINKTKKLNADKVIEHMKYDKKNFGNKLRFVLLKGLNNPVYNQEIDSSLLRDAIKNIYN